ncbi:MAG: aldehyde ferredoxin oxidoreductase [Nitrospirae bacterium]|jgi:aldehyde:ferredoxin oxidoreductase|nr:aldehyde ferredoxin oxidoreductase [Nitrospirota bacterium]
MIRDYFKVLLYDLTSEKGTFVRIDGREEIAGGSGLAALLFNSYCNIKENWDNPEQSIIFTIGPLTGYFPLMSKTVCAFKSPYHNQYAESHGGGRSALCMRFADIDGLVITGKAKRLSCLFIGSRNLELRETHYLRGTDVQVSGKILRNMFQGAGHRSILRIGIAGENLSPMACINIDTYRHFGRLGSGAVMGAKNLKAIVIQGDGNFPLVENKDYPKLFQDVFKQLTTTEMMSKYHNLGTTENVAVLNEFKSLPYRNLQYTSDSEIKGITGETFANDALLRNAACAGCPVGCIHIGFVREKFMEENQYLYRQVSYDHEPVFASGSMLGVKNCFSVLSIIDAAEKMGLDIMSSGVALAWATEAYEKGIISEKETIIPLSFGNAQCYKEAMFYLATGANDFYKILSQGTMKAASKYKGEDFACVLGQEMAGYATGEVFFTSQALGLRHSHLDSAGYSYDLKHNDKNVEKAVEFLLNDEKARVFLTSMVSCLFARNIYTNELLKECLSVLGYKNIAENVEKISVQIQKLRWKTRISTGYDPEKIKIPKRFYEIITSKGHIDAEFLGNLTKEYSRRIKSFASE